MFRREFDARLERARHDQGEPQFLDPFAEFFRGGRIGYARVDQRAESLAECLLCHKGFNLTTRSHPRQAEGVDFVCVAGIP